MKKGSAFRILDGTICLFLYKNNLDTTRVVIGKICMGDCRKLLPLTIVL